MKYVFLNPQSCSGRALSRWEKLKDNIPDLQNYRIVDDFNKLDWDELQVQEGDVFISAGGDGTLHCMVNALIREKGLSVLEKISIGHIGLGSNNSYLRPYKDCRVLHGIAMKISDETILHDLIEVQFLHNSERKIFYCIANASAGFLASANVLFNSEKDIASLKKASPDAADVYTFFKALAFWRPLDIELDGNKIQVTNLHFMKKPFYAADLGFPEKIFPMNKKFRFNLLYGRGKTDVMKRFLKMLLLKDFVQGRDLTGEREKVIFRSEKTIPFEADGEIYYGNEFQVTISEQGIRLCK